jgi:hypothetical protein
MVILKQFVLSVGHHIQEKQQVLFGHILKTDFGYNL